MDKRLLTINIIVFTEVLGFSLILPFLPYYAQSFGASPMTVGLILVVFSACQFISSPIFGKLSDKFGRKPLLLISQLSTMTGFIILAFANSVWMILLSRIVDGLLGSNMTLSRAYLSDISKGKDRRKKMNYMSIIFPIGMFIGPAIGGYLSTISYSIPSIIAAVITLISIILTIIFLKETVVRERKVKITIQDFFPLKTFIKEVKKEELKNTFIMLSLFSLAFSIVTSNMALYIKYQINKGPEIVGLMLMMIGLFRLLFQTTVMPKLIDKKEINTLIKSGLLLLSISFMIMCLSSDLLVLSISVLLLSIGAGLTRPMITTKVIEESGEGNKGGMMGLVDSIWSLAQIFAPLIGGYLIQNYPAGSIGLVSSILVFTALIFSLKKLKNKQLA